jgi:hypothetical protein
MRTLSFAIFVAVLLLSRSAGAQPNARSVTQTLDQILPVKRLLERVDPIATSASLQIFDDRKFQDNSVPSSALDSAVKRALPILNLRSYAPSGARAISVRLRIAYLGFERTEGGTWIARGIVSVSVIDPNLDAKVAREADVTVDQVVGRSRPRIDIGFHRDRLLTSISAGIAQHVEGAEAVAAARFRTVTAVGYVPASTPTAAKLDAATTAALADACARAWGVELEAVAKIVDLADVSTSTRTRARGLILAFSRRDAETVTTSDGYLLVVVDAVVAMPTNSPYER